MHIVSDLVSTYRDFADVTPRLRVVIPEPIIVQSCFRILVLPLVLEWKKHK